MTKEKMTPAEIEAHLFQFCGTEGYHRLCLSRTLVFTDGAKAVAESCSAFWLLDAIWSHQHKALKDPMLRDMQFWTLKRNDPVNNSKGAVLICERDTDDVAIKQEIEYTDFPLESIKLYVERSDDNLWVCLLPSEH